MTDFNPLSGAILGSAEIQHQIGTEKQRQLRRAKAVQKDIAARDDEYEHEVESTEELHPVDDGSEQDQPQRQRKQPRHSSPGKDDDRPHIDLKA